MNFLRTSFFIIAILAFIFLMTVGLSIVASDHHDYRCPFMSDKHLICQMDFFDFVSAWKNAFLTNIPYLILFLSLSLFAFYQRKVVDWFRILNFFFSNGKLMWKTKELLTEKILSIYLISPRAP